MMCVHSRARSHDCEHGGVHAQFRRNKRELSRRREKHQKTRRAQSDGAVQARGAKKGRETSGEGDAMVEEGSEIGRQKEERRRRHKRRD